MAILFLIPFGLFRFLLSLFELALIYDSSFLLETYPNLLNLQNEYAYIDYFCSINATVGIILMLLVMGQISNKVSLGLILVVIIIKVFMSLAEILFYTSRLFIIMIWLELIYIGFIMSVLLYYNRNNFRKKNNHHKFSV